MSDVSKLSSRGSLGAALGSSAELDFSFTSVDASPSVPTTDVDPFSTLPGIGTDPVSTAYFGDGFRLTADAPQVGSPAESTARGGKYRSKKGDSLAEIARQAGIPLSQLLKANPSTMESDALIQSLLQANGEKLKAFQDPANLSPDTAIQLSPPSEGSHGPGAVAAPAPVPPGGDRPANVGGTDVKGVLKRANLVHKIAPGYTWGGGHGARVTNTAQIRAGLDCSGAVSYALALKTPLTSGALANIGKPGAGKNVTIFANAEHTFLRIKDPETGKFRYWGTSGFARPNKGAGWFTQEPSASYLAGFTQRHLPGH